MRSDTVVKILRVLAYPFVILYGIVVRLRNFLYDHRLLHSSSFNLPVICVGNLSVGGTGKSPMVEWIIRHLQERFRVAIVSRGYKRRTRGYVLAGPHTTAIDIGDEPMQFQLKFPDISVAVGEERLVAIPQLLHDRPATEVIVLDDAFQHRAVRAGLNLLLTDSNRLYTRDYLLPGGRLRDTRSSAARAHVIVVTKCSPELTEEGASAIRAELDPRPDQQVFFAKMAYGSPYSLLTGKKQVIDRDTRVLLVQGIANPEPLKNRVAGICGGLETIDYRDHHIFSIDDWRMISSRFSELAGEKKVILTTEKDAVRLLKFRKEFGRLPLLVLPVEHEFLFGGTARFQEIIDNFILNFPREESKMNS